MYLYVLVLHFPCVYVLLHVSFLYFCFASGSNCEVLWWVCLSVGLWVYLSVCPRGYVRNRTRDLYQIFMHVAYVRGSVLLRHVYDRPHRLSPGRGFLPHWKCIIGWERGMECTTRAKYAIYDCLVRFVSCIVLYLQKATNHEDYLSTAS